MNENQADKGPISQEEIEAIKTRIAALKQAQKDLRILRGYLTRGRKKKKTDEQA